MKHVPFLELEYDVKINRCTIPQHVSVTKNPDDETTEQVIMRQDKFLELSEEIKIKLSSEETGKRIGHIGNLFGLELLQIAEISRVVRSYYFGEIKLEDMPQILAREIPIDPEKARQITQMVTRDIIQSNIGKEATNYEKLPLSQALEKYKALGEQLITSAPIKLKIFPSPVRPSIKNWIADYQQNLGGGKHGMMERGNFLYHSENAKRLTADERQRLAVILKSLDEEESLDINTERQEVVFQPQAASSKQYEVSNKQYAVGDNNQDARYNNQIISNQTPIRRPADQIPKTPHPALSQRERGIGSDADYEMFAPAEERKFSSGVNEEWIPQEEKKGFLSKIFGGEEEKEGEPPRLRPATNRVNPDVTSGRMVGNLQQEITGRQQAVSGKQQAISGRERRWTEESNEQRTPAAGISYSSPHKMPVERQAGRQLPHPQPLSQEERRAEDTPPVIQKSNGPHPYRISPRRYFGNGNSGPARKEPKIEGNVVNLKGE